MALVVGTNIGFVTVAPIADPTGNIEYADYRVRGFKATSPAGAVKVVEIGWWCDNPTQAANFEVGIYSHNSENDEPENLLDGASRTNAKGTDAGWKFVTGLDISIDPETIYWITFQLDNTATTTNMNKQTLVGEKTAYESPATTLRDIFVIDGSTSGNAYSIYAVWEAAPEGLNPKVKVSGTFATKKTLVKIGGAFVEKPVMVKVGGAFQ